ncbi:MAG: hypothetical protein JXB19_02240 [Bacteroidales bacterium]|nr:hypothetical protein [Bacteroidales bacterium]
MSSLIQGYNYDIFISYRQKDNKHDGWVTDFVDNLKGELDSTFKEETSVYFDINPHDGLLETHDVDESLKDKLKCLIFIPIISRTYCDPKSFAWEHEFKAFVKQASKDQFGLKVKLPNGNIASRVLPVRIYELDHADIKLCESVLGGVLRAIDFIYSSSGVNRPLRSKEENSHDNLNHTNYRDQINKTANALNDIISGLQIIHAASAQSKTEAAVTDDGKTKVKQVFMQTSGKEESGEQQIKRIFRFRLKKWVYLVPTSVIIILLFLSLIVFSSGSALPFDKRDWVLITDFENLTDNPVFDRSLYTAFSLSVSQSRYINVFPRSRMLESLIRMGIVDQTFVDERTGQEMAVREGINLYIAPNISEVGNRYAIAAKIIGSGSGDILESEIIYAENQDGILPGLDQLSRKIRRDLGESRYNIALQDKPLKQVTTSSLEALKLYSTAIDMHIKTDFEGAKKYYEAALNTDTGFTSARASLGNINIERFDPALGKELLSRAVQSVDKLTERERLGILAFYAAGVENNLPKAIEYNNKRIKLYPDDIAARNNAGWYYQNSAMYEEAVREYKEAVRINPEMALAYAAMLWIYEEYLGDVDSILTWSEKMISENPQNVWGYFYMGSVWLMKDSIGKAKTYYLKAREVEPDHILSLYRLAHTCRIQEQYEEAIQILKHILELDRNEISAYYDMGINYERLGNNAESRKCYSSFKKIATEEWIKEWPDDAGIYIALAAVSARLGDMDDPQELLSKAIGMDSTLHTRFAEVLCLQGRLPEALQQLGMALEDGYRNLTWLKLNPDLWELYYDIRFRNLLEKYFN